MSADWTARSLRGEWWYLCDVCGRPVPYSETTRDVPSLAQRGLRVCLRCVDEPGVDDLREIGNERVADAQRREAEDQAKPA